MKRVLVYSHDTYGLGNLSRMLNVCHYLTATLSDVTVLLISGSPVVHSFRLPPRVDYVKLPCLMRTAREEYDVRSLGLRLGEVMRLRAELIQAVTVNYRPDLFLIDKKPYGVRNELEATLKHVKEHLPRTRRVLILRDILDAPEATIRVWEKHGYYEALQSLYDLALVLGVPEVFDPRAEYRFPAQAAARVHFCGYVRPRPGRKSREEVRRELRLAPEEKLVLVTAGGGHDGQALLSAYLEGLTTVPADRRPHSLIVSGPEMIEPQRQELSQIIARHERVSVFEYTDDLMSYMGAADAVVSMGGYNTVCEIMALRKRAVVVPRAEPVREQLIRAERLSRRGFFKYLHPQHLTSDALIRLVLEELEAPFVLPEMIADFNLDARSEIVGQLAPLLFAAEEEAMPARGD